MASQADSVTAPGMVIRAGTLVAVPWANGGGLTRVIADQPEFRLSLATIEVEGPFSVLPGLVRHFAVVAGAVELSGLTPNGRILDSASLPLTFSGATIVHAKPSGAPTLALNLMVPDAAAAPLRLQRCEGGLVDARAVFACAKATAGGITLEPHDTLFPTGAVQISGPVLIVRR